jgi:hypothetical protein
MSTGTNKDRPDAHYGDVVAYRALQLQRSRLPQAQPANDNAADWRSIWARRFVRPFQRLMALLSVTRLIAVFRSMFGR